MPILNETQILENLDMLDNEFDSHLFIFAFMRRFPKEYAQGLYNYVGSDDPIRVFHAEIGKLLKRRNDLEALGKDESVNVRGLHSANEKWRKI